MLGFLPWVLDFLKQFLHHFTVWINFCINICFQTCTISRLGSNYKISLCNIFEHRRFLIESAWTYSYLRLGIGYSICAINPFTSVLFSLWTSHTNIIQILLKMQSLMFPYIFVALDFVNYSQLQKISFSCFFDLYHFQILVTVSSNTVNISVTYLFKWLFLSNRDRY